MIQLPNKIDIFQIYFTWIDNHPDPKKKRIIL